MSLSWAKAWVGAEVSVVLSSVSPDDPAVSDGRELWLRQGAGLTWALALGLRPDADNP